MGEFELIRTLFRPLAEETHNSALVMGPGDDCAIQRVPPGHELVFSVDTLVSGVHFPHGYDPARLGWRALAVALSDLAAMGATPACYTLALTLPEADSAWVRGLVQGLREASLAFGIALAGGDITRGPLTLSLQVHGTVPQGRALCRSGAHEGDLIAVTGPLGGAAAALDWLTEASPPPRVRACLERYHRPIPRIELACQLQGIATAAIDISDGLLADLGHILVASGSGAELDADSIPRSFGDMDATLDQALYGGDDYELCVTLPTGAYKRLLPPLKAELVVIGRISPQSGTRLVHSNGTREELGVPAGYDHFKSH